MALPQRKKLSVFHPISKLPRFCTMKLSRASKWVDSRYSLKTMFFHQINILSWILRNKAIQSIYKHALTFINYNKVMLSKSLMNRRIIVWFILLLKINIILQFIFIKLFLYVQSCIILSLLRKWYNLYFISLLPTKSSPQLLEVNSHPLVKTIFNNLDKTITKQVKMRQLECGWIMRRQHLKWI